MIHLASQDDVTDTVVNMEACGSCYDRDYFFKSLVIHVAKQEVTTKQIGGR